MMDAGLSGQTDKTLFAQVTTCRLYCTPVLSCNLHVSDFVTRIKYGLPQLGAFQNYGNTEIFILG
jgi:hypothetical protein